MAIVVSGSLSTCIIPEFKSGENADCARFMIAKKNNSATFDTQATEDSFVGSSGDFFSQDFFVATTRQNRPESATNCLQNGPSRRGSKLKFKQELMKVIGQITLFGNAVHVETMLR